MGSTFGLQMAADAAEYDAFVESAIRRLGETFLRETNLDRQGDDDPPRPGRRPPDDEELHEAQFEYNDSRDDFSGMYS